MKKSFFIKLLLIIIIIALIVAIYIQFDKMLYDKGVIEAYSNYNEEQKKCQVVGTTTNYVYISRFKNIEEPIEGAVWNVSDINGNILGTFKTNATGQGGIVGLDYGEYFLTEQSVPNGYEKTDEKYKVIISAVDTHYDLNVVSEGQDNGIVFVVTDDEGNPLEGVNFNIYDKDSDKVIDVTTNAKGLAGIQKVPAGMYYLRPTNLKDDERKFFEMEENEIKRLDLVYEE